MRSGKPEATKAELSCGSRRLREAKAARAKAQGTNGKGRLSPRKEPGGYRV
jgi:hypothetical protein